MYLLTTWSATLLWDGSEVVRQHRIPADPRKLAERLTRLSRGEVLEEELALARTCSDELKVCETRLEGLGELVERPEGVDLTLLLTRTDADPALLHQAVLLMGRGKAREAQTPDLQLLQAVTAFEELTETANLVGDRVGQWAGLSLPELSSQARPMAVARGLAQGMDLTELARAHEIELETTLGLPPEPLAYGALQELARLGMATTAAQEQLAQTIEELMERLAPNLAQVIGPQLGARLMARGGGLARLARMPASAVQLLGAETALFRHLRSGAKPPKHGLIFQHPLIHQSPPRIRGKVARLLAAKTALAARLDFYGGDYLGPQLKAQVQAKVEALRKGKQAPPGE